MFKVNGLIGASNFRLVGNSEISSTSPSQNFSPIDMSFALSVPEEFEENIYTEMGVNFSSPVDNIDTGDDAASGNPSPTSAYVAAPVQLMNQMDQDIGKLEGTSAQAAASGGFKGGQNSHWCCAWASAKYVENGVNIPTRYKGLSPRLAVRSFMSYFKDKGRFKSINRPDVTASNYCSEVKYHEDVIKKQLSQMKSGDAIIWQANSPILCNGAIRTKFRSHIGIIKSVDLKNGTVTVQEGNANEMARQMVNGISIQTDQKISGTDKVMIKTYSIQDLATNGYAGYVDMQGLIK